jgi:hypothetical protein
MRADTGCRRGAHGSARRAGARRRPRWVVARSPALPGTPRVPPPHTCRRAVNLRPAFVSHAHSRTLDTPASHSKLAGAQPPRACSPAPSARAAAARARRPRRARAHPPSRRRKGTPAGCSTSRATMSSRPRSCANTSTRCPPSAAPSAASAAPPSSRTMPHSCGARVRVFTLSRAARRTGGPVRHGRAAPARAHGAAHAVQPPSPPGRHFSSHQPGSWRRARAWCSSRRAATMGAWSARRQDGRGCFSKTFRRALSGEPGARPRAARARAPAAARAARPAWARGAARAARPRRAATRPGRRRRPARRSRRPRPPHAAAGAGPAPAAGGCTAGAGTAAPARAAPAPPQRAGWPAACGRLRCMQASREAGICDQGAVPPGRAGAG